MFVDVMSIAAYNVNVYPGATPVLVSQETLIKCPGSCFFMTYF